MLTIENFPHMAEAIVEAASVEALLALHDVSRWLRELVDVRLLAHLPHDLGSDTTTTTLFPSHGHPMRVDLWSATPKQRLLVHTLDVHYGAYADPNPLPEGEFADPEPGQRRKSDTARILPKLARLNLIVLHGPLHTVFARVLRQQDAKTVIHPVLRKALKPVESVWYELRADIGAYFPADRLIVPLAACPWDFYAQIRPFKVRPMRIDVVLLPLRTPPEPLDYNSTDCATFVSLCSGAEYATNVTKYESVFGQRSAPPRHWHPAELTFVGFEYWNVIARRRDKEKWQKKLSRRIRRIAEFDGATENEVQGLLERIKFKTLEDWKREDVTEAEWDLISALDLS